MIGCLHLYNFSEKPAARPQPAPTSRKIDARQAERLQRVMTPLIKNMNHPLPLNHANL